MTSEELAPRFAEQTYQMLGKQTKDERINKINENIKDTGFKANYEKSNRDIVYYENPDKKQVYISHRGTDWKKRDDVSADLYYAMGQEHHNKAYKKRRDRTSNLVKDIPEDYDLIMSGHSYGGSSVNDTLRNKKNVRDKVKESHTYNSSFNPWNKKINKKDKEQLDKKVTHHRTINDAVSSLSLSNSQFGKVKNYKQVNEKKLPKIIPKSMQGIFNNIEQLHAHSMKNFTK